ncbi:Uncharacterised protein [Mycobacteroides abscessus subsp. abscessus]|nr:Uncharacterised protein [Mycobacteroides abscessus subsp. abscessus]
MPSAVRNRTVPRWVTKLMGKISGLPSITTTSLPNLALDSRVQLSYFSSKVTGCESGVMTPMIAHHHIGH